MARRAFSSWFAAALAFLIAVLSFVAASRLWSAPDPVAVEPRRCVVIPLHGGGGMVTACQPEAQP